MKTSLDNAPNGSMVLDLPWGGEGAGSAGGFQLEYEFDAFDRLSRAFFFGVGGVEVVFGSGAGTSAAWPVTTKFRGGCGDNGFGRVGRALFRIACVSRGVEIIGRFEVSAA